jgi:hypothetical protein
VGNVVWHRLQLWQSKYSFGSAIRSRQLCIGIDLFLGPFGRAGFSRIDSSGGQELLRRIRGVWT